MENLITFLLHVVVSGNFTVHVALYKVAS